jgi:hypothetical protein
MRGLVVSNKRFVAFTFVNMHVFIYNLHPINKFAAMYSHKRISGTELRAPTPGVGVFSDGCVPVLFIQI